MRTAVRPGRREPVVAGGGEPLHGPRPRQHPLAALAHPVAGHVRAARAGLAHPSRPSACRRGRAALHDEVAAAHERERQQAADDRDDPGDEQQVVERGGEGGVDRRLEARSRARRRRGDHLGRTARRDRATDLVGLRRARRAGQRADEAARDLALEDRAEPRDAGRDPDLAKRRADARRHPRPRRRDDADRRVGDRGVDRPDPEARDDEPGQERRPVRLRLDAAHEQQPRPDDQQATAKQPARRQPRGEPARHRRGDERQQRHGQQAQAGLERAVAEDRLQVEREVEEHREHRRRQRERRDRRAGERRLAKQREVEHRLRLAALDEHEHDEQERGRRERADDQRAPPALVVALDEPEDEQEQRGAERRQAEPVDPAGVLVARLGELAQRDRERRDPDRDVEVEDRRPAERLGQRASDERADGDRRAGRRAPQAERRAALAAVELLREQGERGREHRRPADPLRAAGEDQERSARGDRAQHRRDREAHEADREDHPAAEQVRERARRQQQRGERQRVRVDDPLHLAEARPELVGDVRQRDVHDRDVEQQHERRRADGQQGPPLALHPESLGAGPRLPRTTRRGQRR